MVRGQIKIAEKKRLGFGVLTFTPAAFALLPLLTDSLVDKKRYLLLKWSQKLDVISHTQDQSLEHGCILLD